jgi:hypothetical protein
LGNHVAFFVDRETAAFYDAFTAFFIYQSSASPLS